jgi:hypothetical protein
MATGFDALRNPEFWEAQIAMQLGGDPTAHKDADDIHVMIWGRMCRAEVKFSRAFHCNYRPIRGQDYSRFMFKWALSDRQMRQPADAVILIGIDRDGTIYAWVLPSRAARHSLSVTAPSDRRSANGGRLDAYLVPPTEILPAFARVAHGI